MRFATFDDGRLGVVLGDEVADITSAAGTAGGGLSAMRTLITAHNQIDTERIVAAAPRRPLGDVRLGPPVPDPTKIFAAPVNYRDHQSEMSQASHVSALGLFLKAPSSLTGSGGTVSLPYHDRRFDQEGELAAVIGRRARKVSASEALGCVFGYTALLDITMRGGEDRSVRKSFETFTPMGPWIVTADEFGDPAEATLRCEVSGTVRQEAKLRDLIWDTARLVSYASWVTTLEPGDVISTGTPAGVGPLEAGDTIAVEISGIGGRLEVTVSADGAVASHTDGANTGPKPPPPSAVGR